MTHNMQDHGSLLPHNVPPVSLRLPVTEDVAELRQRHHAFILTVAHELRQPLSAMFGAIGILHSARPSTALATAVEIIDRQAHHMDRLVEELIESSEWVRGTTLLRKERVDLRTKIAEAIADAGGAIAARKHVLVAPDTPAPLWIDADPARVRQVLTNLLDNAIKFTDPGGRIELTANRVGRDIVVRVRDTGRGLRPHELAGIFELFSQVRPREGRGLGIGLNVVWQIVALHHGRIEARSDGPSRGSEFTVTLPSADDKD